MAKKVEIYTQPGCPYCVRALGILREQGISFRQINAPRGSAEREEAIRRSGHSTVPQIFVDGKSLGGCDDLVELQQSGKLKAVFG